MMRILLGTLTGGVLAVTALTAPPAVRASEPGKIEQELIQLENNWCAASLKNDSGALAAILADDVTDVSTAGKIGSKSSDLADTKTEKTTVCQNDQMQVRVFGDAAVVVGRCTLKSSAFNGQYRFTDTYIRRGGRWQAVATQSTEIKP